MTPAPASVSLDIVNRTVRTRSFWEQRLGIVDDSAKLSPYRQIGDPELDAIFETLEWSWMERVAFVGELMEQPSDLNARLGVWSAELPEKTPEALREFQLKLPEPIPSVWPATDTWAPKFWAAHRMAIVCSLFYASLPASFAASNGAQVLAATAQMTSLNGMLGRVPRTGEFVSTALMKPLFTKKGVIDEESELYRAIRYIRILHGAVRYMLVHPARQKPWDSEKLGVPINQMDLAGTVLAFGLIVDEPFEKIVGRVDPFGRNENMFLQRWNAIGALFGVDPTLLTNNILDARALSEAIRVEWEEVEPHDAGPQLAKTLLDYVSSWMLGSARNQHEAMLAYLAPRDVARLLHVNKGTAALPPAVIAALLYTLQRTVKNDEAAFELGFKAARFRNSVSDIDDTVLEMIEQLHPDEFVAQVAKRLASWLS